MLEDNMLRKRIIQKIKANDDNKAAIEKAKNYYINHNDIELKGILTFNKENKDPLRNADNRIPHNIHQLLVDEKVSYLFTKPPIISLEDNEELNNQVTEVLGEEFAKKIKDIAIEASNAGVAWLHYWIATADNVEEKENNENSNTNDIADNTFKYELVNSEEIIPIYRNGLEKKLENVIRYYTVKEEIEGKLDEETYYYVEYWTKDKMIMWKSKSSYDLESIETIEVTHTLGRVPFIEFDNNKYKTADLSKIKKLLDLKDVVVSGFANDIEDIQQIIYVLTNYGGANMDEFLKDLKRYKAIKVDNDGTSSSGGVDTMSIDIPVEARNVLIEYLNKQIYEAGQGLQQDIETTGSLSGVALKFFYRKLELKAGLMETEFRVGIKELVEAVLHYLGINDHSKITQTWTRNMISNDTEKADIAQKSTGILSQKTILENHPWVQDTQLEIDRLEKEKKQAEEEFNNNHYDIFNKKDTSEDEETNNIENKEYSNKEDKQEEENKSEKRSS